MELIKIQKQGIGNGEVYAVDARELHFFLGSKQEFAHWSKSKIVNNPFFEDGIDYFSFEKIIKRETGGTIRKEYALTISSAKKVAMAEQTERGNQVRDYFIECERQSKQVAQLPDFSNPAAAARAWADEFEQKRLACEQRDVAIKTKAWIGHKREATAMATASKAVRDLEKVKAQVGDSKTWKQARAIPWLKKFFNLDKTAYIQIGKRLSKESRTMGYEIREIEHSKWQTVKTYHSDVIEHFRHKLVEDLNLMKKYRNFMERCS
ncbi:MAG: antA/AntB antirepressor family protein [Proteobacteria bacterium]|nr:hypothetical protein [Desulfobacula sp.]MBU3951652.1 antA/AntB antirepressor family protein [Pseudomonadota bacterium]MBU4131529.1 antA/AntB antirepressor family protein [Pseudomonadota bacterium]